MIGDCVNGEYIQSLAMIFKKIEAYESYISNIDIHYDTGDNIFTG